MDSFCDYHQSARCRHPLVLYDSTAPLEDRNLSCAAGQLLNQSASTWQSLQTTGTRSAENQIAFKQTALTTLSPDLGDAKLIAATSRLLGVSADSVRSGFRYQNEDVLSSTPSYAPKRARRADAFDKLVVYDFFHPHEPPKSSYRLPDMSQLVSINKNHPNRWKKKGAVVAGESMTLTCVQKVRSGTLGQLSQEFLESETYRQITESNPMLSMCASAIQGCICPCIKEEKISECACPKCSSFEFLTKGVFEGMTSVRRQTGCTDAACAAWTASLKNQYSFFDATMCRKVTLDGFDLLSGKKLIIRCFPCCLSSPLDNVLPCASCGIDKLIPKCECLSTESLSATEITWLKQQETLEGKNHDIVTLRFRDYTGTLGEAMELIRSDHKDVAYHQWCKSFNRHQFHLDCDYFDGDSEIVLLADFASAMTLGGGVKVVCESDSTCNLYVVLVLYKINGETLCDYVRFWSPASTSVPVFLTSCSAEFHHHALCVVKDRYSSSIGGAPPLVPGLQRIHIWTDGHPSTYKGFPNLGRMGYWPLRPVFDAAGKLVPGFEYSHKIEIVHKFFESHHGSGVQDAAGKAARYSLIQQIGFKKASIFNYHECHLWSITNQPSPVQRTRDGHFSASGSYAWYALSDGLDAHRDNYDVIDLRRKTFKPVKGCSECYVFWARDWDGSNRPRILSRRFWCWCLNCRSGQNEKCGLLAVTGLWKQHDVSLTRTWSVEESQIKKAADKEKRSIKRKAKAAALATVATAVVAVAPVVLAPVVVAAEAADGDNDDNDDDAGPVPQAIFESAEEDEEDEED